MYPLPVFDSNDDPVEDAAYAAASNLICSQAAAFAGLSPMWYGTTVDDVDGFVRAMDKPPRRKHSVLIAAALIDAAKSGNAADYIDAMAGEVLAISSRRHVCVAIPYIHEMLRETIRFFPINTVFAVVDGNTIRVVHSPGKATTSLIVSEYPVRVLRSMCHSK